MAVSGDRAQQRRRPRAAGSSRSCNEVAAAARMPSGAFLADRAVKTADRAHRWSLDELQEVSRRFGPSPEAVLPRLVALERCYQPASATWQPRLGAGSVVPS